MIKWFKLIKQLFCKHEWNESASLNTYRGIKMRGFTYCKKCGKIKDHLVVLDIET